MDLMDCDGVGPVRWGTEHKEGGFKDVTSPPASAPALIAQIEGLFCEQVRGS